MAVGGHFQSLSEAITAIVSYFPVNHHANHAGRSRDSVEMDETELNKKPAKEVFQVRFAQEFDGLHCFEMIIKDGTNVRPESSKQPAKVVVPSRFALEFDGQRCFETLVKH